MTFAIACKRTLIEPNARLQGVPVAPQGKDCRPLIGFHSRSSHSLTDLPIRSKSYSLLRALAIDRVSLLRLTRNPMLQAAVASACSSRSVALQTQHAKGTPE